MRLPMNKGADNGESFFFINGIIELAGREFGREIAHRAPSWASTAEITESEASQVTEKGRSWRGRRRVGILNFERLVLIRTLIISTGFRQEI